MTNKDLRILHDLNSSLSEDSEHVLEARVTKISDPRDAVESSLMDFLQHRFQKIQEDKEFEMIVKEALMARITEANFAQLADLLDLLQKNSNSAAEKVLVPFIANQSDRSLLDKKESTKPDSDRAIFEDKRVTKDVLQGLQQLNGLIEALNANKKE